MLKAKNPNYIALSKLHNRDFTKQVTKTRPSSDPLLPAPTRSYPLLPAPTHSYTSYPFIPNQIH